MTNDLELRDQRTERIFKITGEHLETKGLPDIAKRLDWESDTIKKWLEERELIQLRASKLAQLSAVKEET